PAIPRATTGGRQPASRASPASVRATRRLYLQPERLAPHRITGCIGDLEPEVSALPAWQGWGAGRIAHGRSFGDAILMISKGLSCLRRSAPNLRFGAIMGYMLP